MPRGPNWQAHDDIGETLVGVALLVLLCLLLAWVMEPK